MIDSLLHPAPVPSPTRPSRGRRRARLVMVAVLAAACALAACVGVAHRLTDDRRRHFLGADGWPVHGQAAYRLGARPAVIGPHQRPVPIASLAKVMTAYLVLRAHPLADGATGPALVVGPRDVADYRARRADDQSVVAVRAGQRLTERDALLALLLPSANNVAVLLARFVAGGVPAFVRRMNGTARRLGMHATRYTDPSGYAATTVSTAADQLRLAGAVAADATLSDLVARGSAHLPVAGTVHNTDVLLGHDGFVGTKTGSDDAAGGCFMFASWRVVDGQVTPMYGVVLGQRGRHALTAGQYAAQQLVDHVAPRAASG